MLSSFKKSNSALEKQYKKAQNLWKIAKNNQSQRINIKKCMCVWKGGLEGGGAGGGGVDIQ